MNAYRTLLKHKQVALGETIVMPNHIHFIVTLPHVGTGRGLYLQQQSPLQKSISPNNGLHPLVPGSVSSIINHLKGNVTKWCNANGYNNFNWQARFHDHIIRDTKEYNSISNYIANNILKWEEDENNEDSKKFRNDIRGEERPSRM